MPSVSARSAANSTPQSDLNSVAEKNERWAARFGRVIALHGVATIPQALFYYQGKLGLSAQEAWFICCLLADKWDGDLPRTSLKMLAKASSLSLCQIRRIRGSLEEKGFLRVVQSFNEQQAQTSNCYDLAGLFQELELLIAGDSAGANEIQAEHTPPYLHSLSGDWSFVERYGRVLIQRGIATIPQALFTYQADLRLTPQQVWFCCYVLAHKWDTEYPYPSLTRMAERTGYRRTSLQDIKDQLVKCGYLRLVPRSNHDGGQDSNGYDFSGLLTTLAELLQRAAPRPAHTDHSQLKRDAHRNWDRRRGRPVVEFAKTAATVAEEGGAATRQGGSTSTRQGRGAATRQGGSAPTQQPGGAPARQTGGAPARHEEEADQEECDQEDSNHNALILPTNKTQVDAYSSYIANVIFDYSNELGDANHGVSNISQALNVWHDSGLSADEFVALLHQARQLTRSYQNKQGSRFIDNKMAYYFATLRDLVARTNAIAAAVGGSR